MKIFSYIKEHPGKIAVGVFVVGILWLLLRSKGSSQPTVITAMGQTQNDVQAATALQVAQLQATQADKQTQAQASVAAQGIAAELEKVKLQASYANNAATLQADTAKFLANKQFEVFQLQNSNAVSTLQAQINTITTSDAATKTSIVTKLNQLWESSAYRPAVEQLESSLISSGFANAGDFPRMGHG